MVKESEKNPGTNFFDVLIKLIDKGRIGSLLLILLFAVFMYVPFSRMTSEDARGVVEKFVESFFGFPGAQPVPFFLFVVLLIVVYFAKRKIKILQNEVKRLALFRDAFFHFKRQAFEHIKERIEDGSVASYDDLEERISIRDIQQKSSNFKLE